MRLITHGQVELNAGQAEPVPRPGVAVRLRKQISHFSVNDARYSNSDLDLAEGTAGDRSQLRYSYA